CARGRYYGYDEGYFDYW
nr:immunoglobulin heavy chain junction region [Mus musculus]